MKMKRETDLLVKFSVPLILAALALYAGSYFLDAPIFNSLASFLLLIGGASYVLGYSNRKADAIPGLDNVVPYEPGKGMRRSSQLVFRTSKFSSIFKHQADRAWVRKNLRIHKRKGLFYLSLSPSSEIKTHEHTRILFVGVPFLWYTKWSFVGPSCAHYSASKAIVNSSSKNDLTKIWKNPLPSVKASVNEAVVSLYLYTESRHQDIYLPGGLTWEDIHNLSSHPEEFVARDEFEGIPASYVKTIIGLEGSKPAHMILG